MSEQENIQIVQQMCTAFEQGDIATLLNLLAEDVEWFVAGSPEHAPLAGTYYGRDRVAQIFSTVGEYLELQQFQAQDFIAQGNQVAVFGHALGHVKPTNCPLEYDWVHVYTLQGGKTVKFREYLDTAAIAAAFRGTETLSVPEVASRSEASVAAYK
ncbi:nuclear transport factor 2 family protein [Funiculus sociatus GB2-A5]|uniref:Nuclear transport factor 2 family protein n=1 Tax=Funiculus sociatus GB2-A5 TaxID=2933946 RepID=A0ABV0JSZ0_9CYAN|nr:MULTISPECIES: nuclear transport factor 2 family protein [unclassified Trichocoleus]MBD1903932.1 nuclear transport factor 2 family protein [Trichocoleus sp. FACHB-832]MBD2060801.1 nuclear transport factor 2 family protein [Trichocoleus sp. FACHB-6]